ncbi:hypothetical protein DFP73DRAFT_470406 [Morchella snyderi]|nr:hypothetical protein DFP73DRAFT_470406 [Morchella snyderi]
MDIILEPPNYGHLRLDNAGKVYIAAFALWTLLFGVGLVIFLTHRHLPFIRLKNVPLVCAALVMLHIQLSFDILIYPSNGVFPCGLEFWVMNICLPLGIALFQAQNMQLFSLFWGQKHLVWLRSKDLGSANISKHEETCPPNNILLRCWYRWRDVCILRKTYMIIAIGTALQIIVALTIFLISRRFHSGFGLVGKQVSRFQCRAGWEWFYSGIWQAVWTYGYGPFILFKIRKIQDTHRWRLQTTLAILFSLPALPLWLSTWFMPNFYIVNSHWPPNLWFVPGLGAMEFVILFFPIVEIWEFEKRQRKAREEPGHTKFSKYSIAALERALHHDIDRLEEFAATKDFTGENINFLKRVESWKERWKLSEIEADSGELTPPVLRSLYDTAEHIFNALIHRESSAFPLNIEEDVYLPLSRVFGESDYRSQRCLSMYKFPAVSKTIAPFTDEILTDARRTPENRGFRRIQGSREPEKPEYNDERPPTPPRKNSVLSVPPEPPMGFDIRVFDRAEIAVKQMVLTNTWIR